MNIKGLTSKLVGRYGTRDPSRIATEMGYVLIETPLKGIRGYYQYAHRCNIIYLDNRLPDPEHRWVCAHELGHSLLHKGLNRVFMDTCTNMVSSRYENEADRFAIDLIYSDEDLRLLADCPLPDVAECLGISYEIAEYRMNSIAAR